jgi:Luciferase-like monooxygenase
MRLGLVLSGNFENLTRQAHAAESMGIDLAWLEPAADIEAPLVAAAMLAPVTSVIRLAADVPADRHPIEIAEDAFVTDLAGNGRLVLVVRCDDLDRLGESADVILAATASRPFRHTGSVWTIPSRAGRGGDLTEAVRVTPAPAQLELPLWLAGAAGSAAARHRCLTSVVDDLDGGEAVWRPAEATLGAGALRLRRPAILDLDADSDGSFDDVALVARLLAARQAWKLDIATIRPPRQLDDEGRVALTRRLASLVRPRIQVERLPSEVESNWRVAAPEVEGR